MSTIRVPSDGRPVVAPGADALVGIDGNAFNVMGRVKQLLRDAGASDAFVQSYMDEAMSGDYHHLLFASMQYLDAGCEGFQNENAWGECVHCGRKLGEHAA